MDEDDNKGGDLSTQVDFVRSISREGTNVLARVNWVHDMSPLAAETMRHHDDALVKISDNTHLGPAREETKRAYAQLVTNTVMGGGLVAIAGYFLKDSGPGWQKWFAGILVAVAAMFGPAVKQAIEALKKKPD
jgi:hypothetical protein